MKKNKIRISEERHNKDMESLGSIFLPMVNGALSGENLIEVDVLLHWVDMVGLEIARFCYPIKVKYNPKNNCRVLYVEVPAGGFALELRHKEDYIIEKINAYFGYKAIHKLSISQNINMSIRPINKKEISEKTLEETEKKYLSEITSGIKDEKLREILIKLGKNIILSKKGDEKC